MGGPHGSNLCAGRSRPRQGGQQSGGKHQQLRSGAHFLGSARHTPGTDATDVPGIHRLCLVAAGLAVFAERLVEGVADDELARDGERQQASRDVDAITERADVHPAVGTQGDNL